MVTVGLVVLAALPAFGEPTQLVDIETGPSRTTQAQLIEANEQGVLYTQVERDGGTALFWSGWEGAAQRVLSVADAGVKARRFGDGFIVFTGTEVQRLGVEPSPQLTFLTAADDLSSFVETNSTSSVWWAGSAGTFVTDGSAEGTRLFTTANNPRVALGNSLFFAGATLTRVDEAGLLVDTGIPLSFGGFARAGDHLVVGGTPARNELGQDLPPSGTCSILGGGESAWLGCRRPDGGQEFLITDGTPAGTSTRLLFAAGDQWIDTYAASADYVVFDGRLSDISGSFVLARSGSASPAQFRGCFGFEKLVGDVLLGNFRAISLAEFGTCRQISNVERSRQVGRRALLQLHDEGRFLLTDGTDAGSVSVPAELPDWPTASSEPTLVGSDGVRAIYATTQGAWVTDGTASGTRRVGSSAEFFGHSVLALEEGRFLAFASNGDSWEPPFGVLGVAGGLLVGRNGCDAFTVDEERVRRELPSVGCAAEIKTGAAGALIRNTNGTTSLVRAEGTFLLVGDVELAGGTRCGKKACWYVTRDGATGLANVVDLESGANTALPEILTQNGLELVAATDVAVVVSHALGTFAVRRAGGRVVMESRQFSEEPPLHFGVTASGSIVWYSAASSGALRALSGSGDEAVPVACQPLGLSITGDRVNLLCMSFVPADHPPERALWSGTIQNGLEKIAAGKDEAEAPLLPSGDGEAIGFTMAKESDGTGRFVVTDGKARREYAGLQGGDMARVRAGYVFAATRESVPDFELWVLPVQTGCGCGSGGEILLLGALLLFRRANRFSGREGSTARR